MPNFTAGTSFGANDTVTNTKLNALIADATINPECALSINSGTIGTLGCTRGTIGTFNSTTGTVATLNTTTGSVQTLSAGTLATDLTGGTYSGLINSSTGTFTGSIGTARSLTAGTIQTLTASTLTGVLTGGTYTGSFSLGTSCNFTAGTINNFTSSSNASISGVTVGTGNPSGSQQNVAVGVSGTLGSNTTGNLNCAFGASVLRENTTGQFNSAFGFLTLSSNVGGSFNSSLGVTSLQANTSGNDNSAFGYDALGDNTTGSRNSAFGGLSLNTCTTSTGNTAVGYDALGSISGAGHLNTAIGYGAGEANTTGSNNTFIGNGAVNTTGGATASNTIVLGNSAIATLRCQTSTISALSDVRDKSNIEDIPVGIEFINDLRPVKFTWNQRDGMRVGLTDAGFIAQESLDVVNKHNANWIGLVENENENQLAMTPGKLIPVLVKAVQQLSAKVDSLEAQLASK